jgi:FkbM family methyltransferase
MEKIKIEVGANSGRDTDALSSDGSVVYAFEPTHELLNILWEKFKDRPNVKVIPFAVDKENGFATFKVAGQADWGCSSLHDFSGEWEREDFRVTHSYQVPKVTLYDFCEIYKIKRIDYLWIDAQGNDFNCLLSLKDKIDMVVEGRCEVAMNLELYKDTTNHIKVVKPWLESQGFSVRVEPDPISAEADLVFRRDPSQPKKMDVAVCISGGMKYPEKSLNSLRRIFPNTRIKVFIHTWEYKEMELYVSNSYNKNSPVFDMGILEKFGCQDMVVEAFDDRVSYFRDIYDHCRFYTSIRSDLGAISMFYSVLKANEFKRKYEISNGMVFDKVIRMRFDSDILEDLDLSTLDGDCLYIPDEYDWGGLNDQFAVGSSHAMDTYSETFNALIQLRDAHYHPETILKNHIEGSGVEVRRFRFPVTINNR